MPYGEPQLCSQPDCTQSTHTDKWNSIKAWRAGWYFQKDGHLWCPDHRPDWAPPITRP